MIEVLLLHRRMPHEALLAGITATLNAGSSSLELVKQAVLAAAQEHPLRAVRVRVDVPTLRALLDQVVRRRTKVLGELGIAVA